MTVENNTSPELNSEEGLPIVKEIKSKFSFQLKAISVLCILALGLLLLAVISYSRNDMEEANIRLFDLFGLIDNRPDILAMQATSENWLGLVGAFLSDKLINNTFGYPVLLLLLTGIILSWSLFKNLKFTADAIRHSSFILLLMVFFSGFMGSLIPFTWLGGIPFEWCGSVGFFLANTISAVLGNIGAFFIFLLAIFFAIFYKLNFKVSDIVKYIFNNLQSGFKKKEKKIEEESTAQTVIDSEKNVDSTDNDFNPNFQSQTANFNYDIKTSSSPGIKFNYSATQTEHKDDEPYHSQNVPQEDNPFSSSLQILSEQSDKNLAQQKQVSSNDSKFYPKIQPINPGKVAISNQELRDELSQNDFISDTDNSENYSGNISKKTENSTAQNQDNKSVRSVLLDSMNSDLPQNSGQNQQNISVNVFEPDKTSAEELKPLIYADHSAYKLKFMRPTLDLLVKPTTQQSVDRAELELNARILQEKLETFKIEIANLSVTPGPVVTQYEFVPAPGIKISKIEALEDDLAMALKAKGIRIIAPIPGRGTIGVEVPNSSPQMVHFSDIVGTDKFRKSETRLPLALGKTINGDVFIEDLTKMPHLLIAGSTGSGKSVGINTIINSLLYKVPPSDLKFVIIDPKKVELPQYAALSQHYLATSPDVDDLIISNPKDAVSILKSTVLEMQNRYDILQDAMQRNISDYNKKLDDGTLRKSDKIAHHRMPYIVVVIDELADLMLTASKEIEEPIARLAQMARAVGIHLVVATQRPSVDVLTGVIKANFPARISYLVAQKVDSRTILDQGGADQLLGNGDMLFLPPGLPKPIRIQNAFISTDEVERIVNFIGDQKGYPEPYMLPSWEEETEDRGDFDPSNRDPLFAQAARVVINTGQASVSNLQRRLSIGYARAARIMDELESTGIVGPQRGSKPRDIMLDSESQLEAYL